MRYQLEDIQKKTMCYGWSCSKNTLSFVLQHGKQEEVKLPSSKSGAKKHFKHIAFIKKQKTNKTHNIQPLEERASKYRCSSEWQRINDTKNSKISV